MTLCRLLEPLLDELNVLINLELPPTPLLIHVADFAENCSLAPSLHNSQPTQSQAPLTLPAPVCRVCLCYRGGLFAEQPSQQRHDLLASASCKGAQNTN